jgi:putative hydroxymethylpyrimidine transport system substrate-binding protein
VRCRPAIVFAAAVALASGCGAGTSADRATHPLKQVALMLDFTPNAVHAGIYAALARHYDADEGIALHVRPPPSPVDSIKLLEQGRVDFAVLDVHDLAIARERGEPLVGVMAIVERPLASVIAQPQISTPRQLEGRTVGVTGDPSDYAVLDSIVAGAHGRPGTLHTITVGSDAVADLLAGKVSAATAFWNDEGVALALRRPGYRIFRVEKFGAPAYPELVLCARRGTVARRPGLVRAVVKTLVRGYELTIARPAVAGAALERQVPGLDPTLVRADLAALRSSFAPSDGRPGELQMPALRAWATWEARFRLVRQPPDVTALFDPRFAR